MVTRQLQVKHRTGKSRLSQIDILPLCHATNKIGSGNTWVQLSTTDRQTVWFFAFSVVICSKLHPYTQYTRFLNCEVSPETDNCTTSIHFSPRIRWTDILVCSVPGFFVTRWWNAHDYAASWNHSLWHLSTSLTRCCTVLWHGHYFCLQLRFISMENVDITILRLLWIGDSCWPKNVIVQMLHNGILNFQIDSFA